jgi:imidazolonepropionase-like amidohydrolase
MWFNGQDHQIDNETRAAVFAKLLIPGRGEPISKAAVGIDTVLGVIVFVGTQDNLPAELASVPRINVDYLLPGLWDCHTHFTGTMKVEFLDFVATHPAVCGAAIARGFYDTLMAGFTSVRDVGSYAIEAHGAVKAGLIMGPNVYGAGGCIGITGGSSDATTLPLDWVYSSQGVHYSNQWPGTSCLVLADGVDECRRAVRQQIRRGASCIKVVATGGIMSRTDNPRYRQYSDAELHALVDEATLQGRAVAVHAHGQPGIVAAVKAGAHTIEHGSFLDEEAAKLMKERGTTLVSTRHIVEAGLRRLDLMPRETAAKMVMVAEQHLKAYQLAVKIGVKIALGTDIASSNPKEEIAHGRNGSELVWAVKRAGMTPLAAIEAATINGAEALGLQMPKKGLITEGWDADMIALSQNPLKNIELFADAKNIKYVWKSGRLVKSPREGFWPPGLDQLSSWSVVETHDCFGCSQGRV